MLEFRRSFDLPPVANPSARKAGELFRGLFDELYERHADWVDVDTEGERYLGIDAADVIGVGALMGRISTHRRQLDLMRLVIPADSELLPPAVAPESCVVAEYIRQNDLYVRRSDYDGILGGETLAAEKATAAMDGASYRRHRLKARQEERFEQQLGLNHLRVGVEEIESLREALLKGEPFPGPSQS